MPRPIAAVVVASPTRRSVALHTYVSTDKQGQVGDRYVAASGINGAIPELAEAQMRDNRKHWNKNGTRTVTRNVGGHEKQVVEGQFVQAYHVIQSVAREGEGSLDPTDPDAWETAHELGVALARKVAGDGRQGTVWTQIDGHTGCIHNHIVIDSIDQHTGRSFDSSNVKHKNLVATHDQMLAEQGYAQANPEYKPEGKKTAKTLEKSELRELAKHQQWEADGRVVAEPFSVAIMRQKIEQALAEENFTSFEGFAETAQKFDLDVQQRGEKGRGVSYQMSTLDASGELVTSPRQRRRANKLGTAYMMSAIEEAIERNKTMQAQQQSQPQQTQTPPEPPKPSITTMEALDRKRPDVFNIMEQWKEWNTWNEKYGTSDEDDATEEDPVEEQPEEAAEAAEEDTKRIYTEEELVRLVRVRWHRTITGESVIEADGMAMGRFPANDGKYLLSDEITEIVDQWEAMGKPKTDDERRMEEIASGEPKESAEPSAPSRKAKRPSAEEEEAPQQPPIPAEPVEEPAVSRPQPPVPTAAEDEEEERSQKKQPVSERRPANKEGSPGQPKKPGGKQEALRRLGSEKYTEPSAEDDLQR